MYISWELESNLLTVNVRLLVCPGLIENVESLLNDGLSKIVKFAISSIRRLVTPSISRPNLTDIESFAKSNSLRLGAAHSILESRTTEQLYSRRMWQW